MPDGNPALIFSDDVCQAPDDDRHDDHCACYGAAMAAVAGVLLGQFYGVINPYIGFMAGMKAFTAAVLGGIGSIPGAMIGGLILGIAEALSSAYLSTEYKDVVSFALLILVLLVMPTGILGRPEVEKV